MTDRLEIESPDPNGGVLADRYREAIEEHRASVLMGAKTEYDLNDADEALWKVLDA